MGLICNITFVISPEKEQEFIGWVRNELLHALFNDESPACNPALRKLIEAGGRKIEKESALSFALHSEFTTQEEARKWQEIFLLPALGEFTSRFGPEAPFFVTLLLNIPL